MNIKEIEKFLQDNPGYLKWGKKKLAKKLNCEVYDIDAVKLRLLIQKEVTKQKEGHRILTIGDTHIPYEKEGYLDFCKKQYDKYACTEVIHIGDLIDLHATSFHPSMPEAYSAGDELEYTKKKLKKWYEAFPNIKVVRGNHDDRIFRLASNSGITKHWIKDFTEVLEVPNWEFQDHYEINNIIYTHGTGTSGATAAYRRAINMGKSVVMGHLHSEASIMYHKMGNTTLFGMIVGCGVDESSYGMNYAKNFPKKSIMSCGLVIEGEPMLKIM